MCFLCFNESSVRTVAGDRYILSPSVFYCSFPPRDSSTMCERAISASICLLLIAYVVPTSLLCPSNKPALLRFFTHPLRMTSALREPPRTASAWPTLSHAARDLFSILWNPVQAGCTGRKTSRELLIKSATGWLDTTTIPVVIN